MTYCLFSCILKGNLSTPQTVGVEERERSGTPQSTSRSEASSRSGTPATVQQQQPQATEKGPPDPIAPGT